MARSFDGNDDINFGTGADVDIGAAFTATAWVKFPSNFTAERMILAKTYFNGSSNVYKQYLQSVGVGQNDFGFFLKRAGTDCHAYSSANALTAGVWNFVATLWDGTATNPKLYAAVHGSVAVELTPAAATFGTDAFGNTAAANLRVGSRDTLDTYWTGDIAECRLYNVALNLSEIRSVQYGLDPRPLSKPFHAPLWGTHSAEIDLGSGHKSGTLTGTTAANHAPIRQFTRQALTNFAASDSESVGLGSIGRIAQRATYGFAA